MIRNLFIFGFAACLIGVSWCDKDFGIKNAAYNNFDVYDEYQGSLRMQYSDYDPSDRSEDQTEPNHDVAPESDTSESKSKNTEQEHPPYNATNAENDTSSMTEQAAAKLPVTKIPPKNQAKVTNKIPAKDKTKEVSETETSTRPTTNTKPGNNFKNGTHINPSSSNESFLTVPNDASKIAPPKKRLVHIEYYVYKQNEKKPFVNVHLPKFLPNKDVFIMFPGFKESKGTSYGQADYVKQYFNSISSGGLHLENLGMLRKECLRQRQNCARAHLAVLLRSNCTVIGVNWTFVPPRHQKPFIQYRAAIIAGRKVGHAINERRSRERLTIIGHDLGNVAAASLAGILRRPVDYIYGLDQRSLQGPQRNLYLRQDLGGLVQTITTNGVKDNYGHRNFYPNGGNISGIFGHEDRCFFCRSFELLSDDILPNHHDHESTFCTNYEDYVNDYCEDMPQVSYFNRYPADLLPTGNYFITEELGPQPTESDLPGWI